MELQCSKVRVFFLIVLQSAYLWTVKTLQLGIRSLFPLHIVALEFIQSLAELVPF